MPWVSSKSVAKVFDSSTVTTPSLPTLSIASAMISPICGSAAEIEAVAAISSFVSTSFASLSNSSETATTAFSIPRFREIGSAPAATLRRPSRTSAWASTTEVVVPSPAKSSVFFATSLTSSAPIFSYGSSSSISLAMDTPSFVIVGAPHFFSSTTLRPRGPRVTLTASARMLRPRSRPRRASSSKAMIFAMRFVVPPGRRRVGLALRVRKCYPHSGTRHHRVQAVERPDVTGSGCRGLRGGGRSRARLVQTDHDGELLLIRGVLVGVEVALLHVRSPDEVREPDGRELIGRVGVVDRGRRGVLPRAVAGKHAVSRPAVVDQKVAHLRVEPFISRRIQYHAGVRGVD